MQLQQCDNGRDCPHQRALARKLDAKRLRIRRAVVNVLLDTLPRLSTYRMPRRGVHLAQISNHLNRVSKFIHT